MVNTPRGLKEASSASVSQTTSQQGRRLRSPRAHSPFLPRKPDQHLHPVPERRPLPAHLQNLGSKRCEGRTSWGGAEAGNSTKQQSSLWKTNGPALPECVMQTRLGSLGPCCPGGHMLGGWPREHRWPSGAGWVPPLNQTPGAWVSFSHGRAPRRWLEETGSLRTGSERNTTGSLGPQAGEVRRKGSPPQGLSWSWGLETPPHLSRTPGRLAPRAPPWVSTWSPAITTRASAG